MQQNGKLFLLVTLGFLTAFGPFVTDMYLPCLPSQAAYFMTTASRVQLGLTTSMIGLAAGQLFVGPISDKIGRRRPLIACMLLFIAGSVACCLAPDILSFIIFRLFQGLGGAGGIVIAKSVATDMYSGKELAKFMAMIGAVNGVAPIAAPVIGGMLMKVTDWRGIFVVLIAIGIILLALSLRLKESLPAERRSTRSVISVYRLFGTVMRNRFFMRYLLQQAFAMGVMFAYIASSPFIIQQHYGHSPLMFSLCFALNGVATGSAAAITMRFNQPQNAVLFGAVGMFVLAGFTALCLAFDMGFWVYETTLFLLLFFVGITLPASTSLAMDSERQNAGTASAAFGAASIIFGGIVSPLVGIGNIMTSSGITIFICATISILLVSTLLVSKFRK